MSNSWQYARALWRAAEERPIASRGAVLVLKRHYAEPGIVERMSAFEAFCKRTGTVPHVWGKSDCSLLPADWVVENGHADPAAEWRGTYDSEQSCKALLEARGGLIGHVSACAAQSGLTPISEPEFGCVAVIGSERNPERQWTAIWNGARWIVRWVSVRDSRETPAWTPFAAAPLGIWRV